LTAVFVGWIWGTQRAHQEIEKHENELPWAKSWKFLIRYITPVAVGIVFIAKVFN
jgi:SNF family Na+-dependent transporter